MENPKSNFSKVLRNLAVTPLLCAAHKHIPGSGVKLKVKKGPSRTSKCGLDPLCMQMDPSPALRHVLFATGDMSAALGHVSCTGTHISRPGSHRSEIGAARFPDQGCFGNICIFGHFEAQGPRRLSCGLSRVELFKIFRKCLNNVLND